MRIRLSLVGGIPGEFVFGPEGGTFGRSQKCQWILSDEERILSAIHGRIVFENHKFMLIDESTNGIFLDGRQQPIGRGNGVALVSGLRFRAARHLIEAQILPAQNADPFAILAASPSPKMQNFQPTRPNAAPSAEQALRERGDMGDIWAKNSQDPLAYLGSAPLAETTGFGSGSGLTQAAQPIPRADPLFAPSPHQPDPFAGLGLNGHSQPTAAPQIPGHFAPMQDSLATPAAQGFQPQPPAQPAGALPYAEPLPHLPAVPTLIAAPPSPPAPIPVSPPQKLIPDDFDPLSILAAPIRKAPELRQDMVGNFSYSAPLPAAPAAPLAAQPAAIIPVMPLPQVPNAGSIPQFPIPPSPMPSAPIPPAPVPSAMIPPARESLSPSLMADIARLGEPAASRPSVQEQIPGDFDAIAAMKARREERKAKLMAKAGAEVGQLYLPVAAPMPPSAPAVAAPMPLMPSLPPMPQAAQPLPGPVPSQPSMPAIPAAMGAENAALIALFAGMGLQGADITSHRQDQTMREVGEMVRAFSEGLIMLLSARRMVKSEFRMDETQVQPEENNPFKHFKMAELALDELFVTRSGGFQAPAEAAGSALEDLKQHVMLTMAAMQRAIKLLMERLSPENVAQDHEAEGAHRIRGLVSRKGKWETYAEMHQRMSGNFDGVARQLIAEAFAQVQEEQARRVASQYWENRK